MRILATLAAATCAATLAIIATAAETIRGSGNPVTEDRAVAGFQGLSLAVPGKLVVTQGDAEKLAITADDNVLPLIETVVERGELRIRFRERGVNLRTKTPIQIALSAKTLEALAIAGSGEIRAPALNAKSMKVSISGSGDVTLGGRAQSIDVNISGSGDVKAGKFETQSASVSIAGSGDSTLWVKDSLKVSIAGSGDVRYYGDPTVQRSVAGSGSVRRAGATPG